MKTKAPKLNDIFRDMFGRLEPAPLAKVELPSTAEPTVQLSQLEIELGYEEYEPPVTNPFSGQFNFHPNHPLAGHIPPPAPPKTNSSIMKMKPRTQKAKGLHQLKKSAEYGGGHTPDFELVQNKTEIDKIKTKFPVFARPCPITPRHGFVESTIIKTKKQLEKLWDDAVAADPDAEVIIMKPVVCKASAILTPYQVTIGPGNDGATQGHQTISLPIGAMDTSSLPIKAAGIKDTPYLEVLFPKANSFFTNDYPYHDPGFRLVQLRDGPAVKKLGDLIPKDTVVTEVINTDDHTDLLAWETLMANAKPGTVVYHPGGNAISHYAVHAVLNKIPVLFDKEPSVGDKLVANLGNKTVYVDKVYEGMKHGFGETSLPEADMAAISLFATHHAMVLKESEMGAYLLGASAAFLVRLTTAACLGEVRHTKSNFSDTKIKDTANKEIIKGGTRESVYYKVKNNFGVYRKKLVPTFFNFKLEKWGTGFGGKKWADCTAQTINLDNRIMDFKTNKDEASLDKLIAQMHTLTNCVHNGGSILNKFYFDNDMDNHAKGEIGAILRSVLAFFLWKQKAKTEDNKFMKRKKLKIESEMTGWKKAAKVIK